MYLMRVHKYIAVYFVTLWGWSISEKILPNDYYNTRRSFLRIRQYEVVQWVFHYLQFNLQTLIQYYMKVIHKS